MLRVQSLGYADIEAAALGGAEERGGTREDTGIERGREWGRKGGREGEEGACARARVRQEYPMQWIKPGSPYTGACTAARSWARLPVEYNST